MPCFRFGSGRARWVWGRRVAGAIRRCRVLAAVGLLAALLTPVAVTAGAGVARAAGPGPASTYIPVAQTRLFDSNNSGGNLGSASSGASPTVVQITGGSSPVPAGATAVAMDVTVVPTTTDGGHLDVWPSDEAKPATSNLNWSGLENTTGFVTSKLSASGQVDLSNWRGSVRVLVDLDGYYAPGVGAGYVPVDGARVYDTRVGTNGVSGPLGPAQSEAFPMAGLGGVPASGVTSVAVDVTTVAPTAQGFLTVYADGSALPAVSNTSVVAGEIKTTFVVARLGTDGAMRIYNNAGSTQVVVDVVGYYTANGNFYSASTPSRLVDTRVGGTKLAAGETRQVAVPASLIAAGTSADGLALNVTVTNPTGTGPFSAYGATEPVPATTTLSVNTVGNDHATSNFAVVKVTPPNLIVDFTNQTTGTVDLVVDYFGYYTTGPTPGVPQSPVGAPGNGLANVVWAPPASNGGDAIDSYVIQAYDTTTSPAVYVGYITACATCDTATYSGLTNGRSYLLAVYGHNFAGYGPAGDTASVTPNTNVPTATNGAGAYVPGSNAVTSFWYPPTSAGTSPLSEYLINAYDQATGYIGTTTVVCPCGKIELGTATNLTAGHTYFFAIYPVNTAGFGPPSVTATTMTNQATPGPPTNVAVTGANSSLGVTWTPPTLSGTSAIDSYQINTYDLATGAATYVTVPCPCSGTVSGSVTGLNNGDQYLVGVFAHNTSGFGAGGTGNAAVAIGPQAPTNVIGYPGNSQADITFNAPAYTGTSPVDSYAVVAYPQPSGPPTSKTITCDVSCDATPISTVLAGLTNGTAYSIDVYAHNAAGQGPAGVSAATVTPTANPAPYPPQNATASPGNTSAYVSWSPPPAGSAAVTSYYVQAYETVPAVAFVSQVQLPATATSTVVPGLVNGDTYVFNVVALNAAGYTYATTGPVIPTATPPPFPVTNPGVVSLDTSALVTWTPPTAGAAPTGYLIEAYTVSPNGALTKVGAQTSAAGSKTTGPATCSRFTPPTPTANQPQCRPARPSSPPWSTNSSIPPTCTPSGPTPPPWSTGTPPSSASPSSAATTSASTSRRPAAGTPAERWWLTSRRRSPPQGPAAPAAPLIRRSSPVSPPPAQ